MEIRVMFFLMKNNHKHGHKCINIQLRSVLLSFV